MENETITPFPGGGHAVTGGRALFGRLFLLSIFVVIYLFSFGLNRSLASAGGMDFFRLPSGVFLAVLIITPRKGWKRILPLFFCLDIFSHAAEGRGMLLASGVACADTAEAVLGAWMLGNIFDREVSLESLGDVIGFVAVCACFATALGAWIGAGASVLFREAGFLPGLWLDGWTCRMIGVVLVVPPVLAFRAEPFRMQWPDKGRLAEVLLVSAGALGIVRGITGSAASLHSLAYLFFPLLIWIALRFGARGSSLFPLLVAVATVWWNASSAVPLSRGIYPGGPLGLQMFFGMLGFSSLALSAMVTAGRRTGEALEESEFQRGSIVDSALECIITVDHRGRIAGFNPRAEEVFGYRREKALGLPVQRLIPASLLREALAGAPRGKAVPVPAGRVEVTAIDADGMDFPAEITVSRVSEKPPSLFTVCLRDITRLKNAQDQLAYEAYHDNLTGLPSRQLFDNRLEIQLIYAERTRGKFCLMALDLDNFKNVNDSLGYRLGDRFLMEVALRIRNTIREDDTVSRAAGDEFIILVGDLKQLPEDAIVVARRILRRVEEVMILGGRELHPRASIGMTLYPSDGSDGESLLKNAEMAMHKAKERGKNNIHLYTASLNAAAMNRIDMESSLNRALENSEFRVHYQPKFDMRTERPSGTEALIRWQQEGGGMVSPYEFIPLAEESGLIVPMGLWIMETACRQTRMWQEAGYADLSVAVNLSARQFQEENLAAAVGRILERTGLSPEFLNLEITENILMADVDAAIRTMGNLSGMGIKLSIDDFGTGYSSLNYLKRFPVDVLKIDRSFVKDIPNDPNDMAIAKAVLALGRSLNMKVVAEGVENSEQVAFMRKHGAHEIQGFFYCRPLPADQLLPVLTEAGEKLTGGEGR